MKTQDALDQIIYIQKLITQTRLRAADGYPYFLVWGILWILGYIGSIWLSHTVWWMIGLIGGIISGFIGFTHKNSQPIPPLLKKLGWLGLILLLYAMGIFSLLLKGNQNSSVIVSFWPFQIGFIYLAAGIFVGREIVLIGCWMIFVAVTGLWLAAPLQTIWLATGGGGGLILTGILLRKRAVNIGR